MTWGTSYTQCMYSSFWGAVLEDTTLHTLWIAFEMRVRVRDVCSSWGEEEGKKLKLGEKKWSLNSVQMITCKGILILLNTNACHRCCSLSLIILIYHASPQCDVWQGEKKVSFLYSDITIQLRPKPLQQKQIDLDHQVPDLFTNLPVRCSL
jgi:hypothetical protein